MRFFVLLRLRQIFVGLLILLVAGYIWNLAQILKTPMRSWSEDPSGDCGIVLTGGAGRVRAGFDLVAQKSIRRLVIAGANPQSTLREIFPSRIFYGDLRESDFIVEKRSRTTYGNAQQSLAVVEAIGCRHVILITSRIHMYRALRTFQAVFPPEIRISEYPLQQGRLETGWWELGLETVKSLFYSLWAY